MEEGLKNKVIRCDGKMEVFSRVVGYFSPTNQWNLGKKAEFKDRKMFNVTNNMGIESIITRKKGELEDVK